MHRDESSESFMLQVILIVKYVKGLINKYAYILNYLIPCEYEDMN